jgi:hypothetical protein
MSMIAGKTVVTRDQSKVHCIILEDTGNFPVSSIVAEPIGVAHPV